MVQTTLRKYIETRGQLNPRVSLCNHFRKVLGFLGFGLDHGGVLPVKP